MQALNRLLQKEMTRKQFLATLGIAAATIFGFGNILKLFGKGLSQPNSNQGTGETRASYGGAKSNPTGRA